MVSRGFPIKLCMRLSSLPTICLFHILLHGATILIILGEKYKLLSSSPCIFLHHVTSALLDSNSLPNSLVSSTCIILNKLEGKSRKYYLRDVTITEVGRSIYEVDFISPRNTSQNKIIRIINFLRCWSGRMLMLICKEAMGLRSSS